MPTRQIFIIIIFLIATLTAQEYRQLQIQSVTIDSRKSNGKYWDFAKGAPDIVIKISTSEKEYSGSPIDNRYIIEENIDTDIEVTIGTKLKIEVWDKDMAGLDKIGFCELVIDEIMFQKEKSIIQFDSVKSFEYQLIRLSKQNKKHNEEIKENEKKTQDNKGFPLQKKVNQAKGKKKKLKITGIHVADKKPNGEFWDEFKGAPDIFVQIFTKQFGVWKSQYTSAIMKDQYKVHKIIDIPIELTIGEDVKISVLDKDLVLNDIIGSYYFTVTEQDFNQRIRQIEAVDSIVSFKYSFSDNLIYHQQWYSLAILVITLCAIFFTNFFQANSTRFFLGSLFFLFGLFGIYIAIKGITEINPSFVFLSAMSLLIAMGLSLQIKQGIFNYLWIILILFYQKFISPHKGFQCAHRILHSGDSCSQHIKKIAATHSLFRFVQLSYERLQECQQSNQLLQLQNQSPQENISHTRDPISACANSKTGNCILAIGSAGSCLG